jgi:hypothetical protein
MALRGYGAAGQRSSTPFPADMPARAAEKKLTLNAAAVKDWFTNR